MKQGACLQSAHLEMMALQKRGVGRGVQTVCHINANCRELCWTKSGQDERKHRTETMAKKRDSERRKIYS